MVAWYESTKNARGWRKKGEPLRHRGRADQQASYRVKTDELNERSLPIGPKAPEGKKFFFFKKKKKDG